METHVLETSYRGAILRLEFDETPSACLKVNGLIRETRHAEARESAVLHLTSTVQTDYEWHEFIEAIVDYNEEHIKVRLLANNAEIAAENFER